MPYNDDQWISPELVLGYHGVDIYHDYKDDRFDRELAYGFQIRIGEDPDMVEDLQAFDIREITGYDATISPVENLRKMIDNQDLFRDLQLPDMRVLHPRLYRVSAEIIRTTPVYIMVQACSPGEARERAREHDAERVLSPRTGRTSEIVQIRDEQSFAQVLVNGAEEVEADDETQL